MNFSVSNPRAMTVPKTDINLSGIVPNKLSGECVVIVVVIVVIVVVVMIVV